MAHEYEAAVAYWWRQHLPTSQDENIGWNEANVTLWVTYQSEVAERFRLC